MTILFLFFNKDVELVVAIMYLTEDTCDMCVQTLLYRFHCIITIIIICRINILNIYFLVCKAHFFYLDSL